MNKWVVARIAILASVLIMTRAQGYCQVLQVTLPGQSIFGQQASSIPFHCHRSIDTLGGHLQGIQRWIFNGESHFILSGSSRDQAYLAMVNGGQTAALLDVYPLMDKPFKHAGGIQVFQNYLAVGIEDNERRNYSFVMIYELDVPNKTPTLVTQLERKGEFERATAGCIALTHYQNQWWMVVGDWDTRHLDFYQSRLTRPDSFRLEQSMATADLDRQSWSDKSWLPYQNINFFQVKDKLFLGGMTSKDAENILDVFLVHLDREDEVSLKKIARKSFPLDKGRFVWGAGISIENNGDQVVYTCERNLKKGINYLQKYVVKRH